MDRPPRPRDRRSWRSLARTGGLAVGVLLGCEAPPAAPSRTIASFELLGPADQPAGEATIQARGDGGLVGALALHDLEGERVLAIDDELSLGTGGISRYAARIERGGLVSRIDVAADDEGLRWRERRGLAIIENHLDRPGPTWVVSEAIEPRMELPAGPLLPWYALAPTLPREAGEATTLATLNLAELGPLPLRVEVREVTEGDLGGARVPLVRLFASTVATGHTLWIDGEDGELLAIDDLAGARARRLGWRAPEAPRPPLPPGVREEELVVATPEARLAGTLTLPAAEQQPAPAILLIHGSGPMDRDEAPFMIFRDLADALGGAGWAVARYDKRGFGASERLGDPPPPPTFDALVADAGAWLDALDRRPELRRCRVVLGHSEGAMIAPTLARRRGDVDGVVLLAGPVDPLLEILAAQLELILPAHGLGPAAVERARRQQQTLFRQLERRDLDALPADLRDSLAWMRSHRDHRPADDLAALRAPILALYGEADLQVPIAQADKLRALAREHGLALRVETYPGRDHLLMDDHGRPGMGLLRDPDRRIDPRVIARITAWLSTLPCAAKPAP